MAGKGGVTNSICAKYDEITHRPFACRCAEVKKKRKMHSENPAAGMSAGGLAP